MGSMLMAESMELCCFENRLEKNNQSTSERKPLNQRKSIILAYGEKRSRKRRKLGTTPSPGLATVGPVQPQMKKTFAIGMAFKRALALHVATPKGLQRKPRFVF